MHNPRSNGKQSTCDHCCWAQLKARPVRLLIAISVLLLCFSLFYFASTSVELMQTISTIAEYKTTHPTRPWNRKLIEKQLAATTSSPSADAKLEVVLHDDVSIQVPSPAAVIIDEKLKSEGLPTTTTIVPDAAIPIAYHDPDLSSCTHFSPQSRASFLQSARALRDPTSRPTNGPTSSSAIPKQLLWNFGLWDRGSNSDQASEAAKYELADGIVLDSSHPFLSTLPPSVRDVMNCWLASHPPSAGWKHLLWNRASSLAFMHQHHGDLIPLYKSFTRIVQRSDLLRVLLLQQFGGIYLDVDVRAKQEPLESLWKEFAITIPLASASSSSATAAVASASKPSLALFFEETILSPAESQQAAMMYPIRKGKREECQRMANYLLASSPQHSIWAEVVQKIRERYSLQISSDYDVLFTTGPALLTEVVYTALGAFPVRSDFQGCIIASDYSLGASSPPIADSQQINEARQSIRVVQRPHDQRWFDHMVKGTWRHAADRG